jgi:hypothetical protein
MSENTPAAQPAAKPAAKPATKAAAKPATKAAAKPATKAAAKPAAKPATKAATKPAGKPAAKRQPAKATKAKAEPVASAASVKPVKLKLVRDSFTMPEQDHALIAQLKKRALAGAHAAKKSEVLRAALHLLASLSDAELLTQLRSIPPVKTGRPRSRK